MDGKKSGCAVDSTICYHVIVLGRKSIHCECLMFLSYEVVEMMFRSFSVKDTRPGVSADPPRGRTSGRKAASSASLS